MIKFLQRKNSESYLIFSRNLHVLRFYCHYSINTTLKIKLDKGVHSIVVRGKF